MVFYLPDDADYEAAIEGMDRSGFKKVTSLNPYREGGAQTYEDLDGYDAEELVVIENQDSEVVGTLQLSFIQYLTYQGGIRAQIEALRVREDQRGPGIGEQLFRWAIDLAKDRGAHLVQHTTDKKRPEALKFYEKLGFQATHEEMKRHL